MKLRKKRKKRKRRRKKREKRKRRRKKRKKLMNNKNLGIIIVVTALSVLFWFLADRWILSPARFSDLSVLIPLLVSFIVLVSSAVIAFLVLNRYVFKITLVFLLIIPFFIFFKFSFYYLLSATLMIWFQMYAIKLIREEAAERHKINIRMILRRGAPPILTAFFIMISFAYFLSPAIQSIAYEKTLPPTFNQAVRQVFTTMFKGELEQLPPEERKETESKFVSQAIKQANDIAKPFFQYMPPFIAFGLFLALQGLSLIFVWLALGIGIMTFSLLKKFNFFRITEVQVKSEILEI
jgi:hypothetical protein